MLLASTAVLAASMLATGHAKAAHPLAGSWTLVAAEVIRPTGARERDYGENPKGFLIVDDEGRYSLQIFRSDRPRFAANDKSKGSAEEFRLSVMGASTHYGTLTVDTEGKALQFSIDGAVYPNWENTQQRRGYTLEGDVLTYRVPARPDGGVPLTVWRRIGR